MIQALTGYINIVLSFFYTLFNNYGIAIIMLTALVNLITFPLTRKQLQASQKMQEIQPELRKIQEKYKNDKEKSNQATMEFMKENKVNPLGGCLPLLIQFPIIIAVFQLLKQPEMISQTVPNFSPLFLFWDLTKADPFYILPIMAAAATFFHQRLVITDPKQKLMLYIFPIMILVISVNFPSGLILYWFTNSLFSVGNHYLMKKNNTDLLKSANSKKEKETNNDNKENEEKRNEENSIERINKNLQNKNIKEEKLRKKESAKKNKGTGNKKNLKKKATKGKKKGVGKAK